MAYFSWELGLPLPVEPEQLFPAINQLVVTTLGTLLGVAGVFVAVLGHRVDDSADVRGRLGRPAAEQADLSRSWLFLAKFFGGCAFIAINAAYFIGGLWLILGLRFGLWNAAAAVGDSAVSVLVRHLLRRFVAGRARVAQCDRFGRAGHRVLVRVLVAGHGQQLVESHFAQSAPSDHDRAGRRRR